jgi:sialate O-acetylesterase
MVLQRGRPVPVWGWAAPGEAVSVTFRGQTYPASAPDAQGRWQATLPATPAGGPYTLTVKGQNTIELTDVLVGDVWLASGQSNMQFKVKDPSPVGYQPVQNADQEIAAANYPRLRLLTVSQALEYRPQAEVPTTGWQVCSPATVASFSAVAYFFGRDLLQHYQVPIGLVVSSWGGTPAEAWVSAEGLGPFPEFAPTLAGFAQRTTSLAADQRTYETRQQDVLLHGRAYDRGYPAGGPSWADPATDAHAWPTMPVPGIWESQPGLGTYDGIVWLRKELELPAAAAGQPLTLSLGQIDDADSTYFNGQLVGHAAGYSVARTYQVPPALVRAGRNVLVVRVVDTGGGGGLTGGPPLQATGPGGTVSLAGPWQYQLGLAPQDVPQPPYPGGGPQAPSVLYNAMIAPLRPLALKGVIWYQGESNVGRAAQYQRLFPALITDWRRQFGQPELPFFFVQLANYLAPQPEPGPSAWAELREAQASALALPATGMATAIDLGVANDIHPHNKQDVGRRLALAARRVAYADPAVVSRGPSYAGLTVAGSAARVRFAPATLGGGLTAKGGKLQGFAVAGADQQFHWATARLAGAEVVVESPQVPHPVAVRYDWADNPNGTLYNRASLPAPPFRTDKWAK